MSLRTLIAVGVSIGIGVAIGAGVVWVLAQPTIDELRRRVMLLEGRIYEFQTRYETDSNRIREEYSLLYNQIQDLKKTTLTLKMKQKVEELFYALEQAYPTAEEVKESPKYVYIG